MHSVSHSPTGNLHYNKWSLHSARWGITIYRLIKTYSVMEHSYRRMQWSIILHRMHAFQISCFMHHIADNNSSRYHEPRSMTILITRSVMTHESRGESTIQPDIEEEDCALLAEDPGPQAERPVHVITNSKSSHANSTEPCKYSYFTPSTSTYLISSLIHVSTTLRTPKVSSPQQIIWVWPCTICPGTATIQV